MKKNKLKNIISFILIILSLVSFVSVVNLFNDKNNGSLNGNDNKVDFSSMTYLALGDSITYGENPKTHTQVENGGYPQLVKEQLGLKEVVNYGVSGTQTHSMIDRVSNMQSNADIVSVMGGTNDCYQSVPIGTINDTGTSTFYGRVKLLAVKLKAKYSNSFIFFMTPYKSKATNNYVGNANGNTLEDYANVIIEICNLYDIPVLDMYNQGNFEIEMFNSTSDGTHPSAEFFEKYTAPQIAKFIKDNYK